MNDLDSWLREAAAIAGTPEWLLACRQVEQLLHAGGLFDDVRFDAAAFESVAAQNDLRDELVEPLADEAFIAQATQSFVQHVTGPDGDDLTRVLAAIALLLLMKDKTVMARMVFAAQLAERGDESALNHLLALTSKEPILHLDELLRLLSLWETAEGDRFLYVQAHLDETLLTNIEKRLTGALAKHFPRHRVLLTISALQSKAYVPRDNEDAALLQRCFDGDDAALDAYQAWLAGVGLTYEAEQMAQTLRRLRAV